MRNGLRFTSFRKIAKVIKEWTSHIEQQAEI